LTVWGYHLNKASKSATMLHMMGQQTETGKQMGRDGVQKRRRKAFMRAAKSNIYQLGESRPAQSAQARRGWRLVPRRAHKATPQEKLAVDQHGGETPTRFTLGTSRGPASRFFTLETLLNF